MPDSSDRLPIRSIATDLFGDRATAVALLVVLGALTITNYVAMPRWFFDTFPAGIQPLAQFAWWAGLIFLTWFLVPFFVAARFGFDWRALGLSARGLAGKLWVYGLLYLVSLAFIAAAATQPGFLDTYPFLRAEHLSNWSWRLLLGYWAIYAVQFFCVEFLFRGFMIFMLRPRLGYGAILVMVVPYAMIHFVKPAPEALAAIPGGLILGWMAFRTRSIWGGVLLHVAIALTIDFLALANNNTGFPTGW